MRCDAEQEDLKKKKKKIWNGNYSKIQIIAQGGKGMYVEESSGAVRGAGNKILPTHEDIKDSN